MFCIENEDTSKEIKMQENDGWGETLSVTEVEAEQMYKQDYGRVVFVGKYFKIGKCYFRISAIAPEGIVAKGVTRKDYFDSKRKQKI